MKKEKIIALLAAMAVVCGGWMMLNNQMKRDGEESTRVSIVAAKENLSEGTVIDGGMIISKEILEKDTPSGAFLMKEKDMIIGKSVKYPILNGEPVVVDRLEMPGEEDMGLAAKLKNGYRAYTMLTEVETGVAGMILPGNWVDVMFTYEKPLPSLNETEENKYTCRTGYILQNIEVLAVDKVMDRQEAKSLNNIAMYESVTLSLKPDEAAVLATYQESDRKGTGRVRLVLRGNGDTAIQSDSAVLKDIKDIYSRVIEVVRE